MSEETIDLGKLMDERASTYGLLSRLFRTEVDREALKELQGMRFPVATGNSLIDKGFRQMYDYLKTSWDDSVTELAIDYVRCFIGHGVNGYSAAYPFESVYTSERRLLMQEARAEVLQILRDNNRKRGSWNEGEDHIALEFEFMQRLSDRTARCLRENDEDRAIENLKTQAEFLDDHILNWLPMLVSDMGQFAQTSFYLGLGDLALGYSQEDAALLGELLENAGETAA